MNVYATGPLILFCNQHSRDSSHGTQPGGVERADEDVRRDAPLRLLVEVRELCKARQGKAKINIDISIGLPHAML